jgi:hypothetical protein
MPYTEQRVRARGYAAGGERIGVTTMPTKKRLMSVVDAAGYAMAPADDMMAGDVPFQPEVALRNGHKSASRTVVPTRPEPPSAKVQHLEAWAHWARDILGLSGPRATA